MRLITFLENNFKDAVCTEKLNRIFSKLLPYGQGEGFLLIVLKIFVYYVNARDLKSFSVVAIIIFNYLYI